LLRRDASLEVLPYSLDRLAHTLDQLCTLLASLPEHLPTLRDSERSNAIHRLPDEVQASLSWLVDDFLSSSRRVQNALIPYISAARRESLPSSLSDYSTRLEREGSSESLSVALVSYWQRHGRALKYYRDLLEHHAVVVSDGSLVVDAAGQPRVCLLFPSVPDDLVPRAPTYSQPYVHAWPYLADEFSALIRLVRATVAALLSPSRKGLVVLKQRFKVPLSFGVGSIQGWEGLSLPPADSLYRLMAALEQGDGAVGA
jgi:hypothetical protein